MYVLQSKRAYRNCHIGQSDLRLLSWLPRLISDRGHQVDTKYLAAEESCPLGMCSSKRTGCAHEHRPDTVGELTTPQAADSVLIAACTLELYPLSVCQHLLRSITDLGLRRIAKAFGWIEVVMSDQLSSIHLSVRAVTFTRSSLFS